MIPVIVEGILYGLFLAILVGPLLVTLVKTTVLYGRKKGLAVGLGIWISDALFIFGVTFFSIKYIDIIASNLFNELSIAASITFISMGLFYILKKQNENRDIKPVSSILSNIFKGFIINTINPFTLVFWTSLAAKQVAIKKYDGKMTLIFFITILFVIIITDSVKVWLSHLIVPFLKSKYILYLKYFTGIVFVVTGVWILIKFIFH